MKKFIFILSVMFGCISCAHTPSKQIDSTRDELIITSLGTLVIYKYEYEGHSYQLHYCPKGNATVEEVIHDPDCSCFSDKDSIR